MDSKFSDLVLRCKGKDFNVHQNIVCPRSAIIAAAAESCLPVRFASTQSQVLKLIIVNLQGSKDEGSQH